ncbi:hypothetical protein N9N28_04120 [Rubripirellula amarantea]|nr:hypothetical protein [Rubripirellula amarantea]
MSEVQSIVRKRLFVAELVPGSTSEYVLSSTQITKNDIDRLEALIQRWSTEIIDVEPDPSLQPTNAKDAQVCEIELTGSFGEKYPYVVTALHGQEMYVFTKIKGTTNRYSAVRKRVNPMHLSSIAQVMLSNIESLSQDLGVAFPVVSAITYLWAFILAASALVNDSALADDKKRSAKQRITKARVAIVQFSQQETLANPIELLQGRCKPRRGDEIHEKSETQIVDLPEMFNKETLVGLTRDQLCEVIRNVEEARLMVAVGNLLGRPPKSSLSIEDVNEVLETRSFDLTLTNEQKQDIAAMVQHFQAKGATYWAEKDGYEYPATICATKRSDSRTREVKIRSASGATEDGKRFDISRSTSIATRSKLISRSELRAS